MKKFDTGRFSKTIRRVKRKMKKHYLSKDTTMTIKGIAIILMLIHHLFSCSPEFVERFNVSTFFIPLGSLMSFSAFSNFCVSLFVFVSRADQNENGDVDYTDPIQHEKANPNYRVTIRPEEIMNDALQAQNDPQQRKDFLSRSLNVYTTAMKAYFNIEEFRSSDSQYGWTLEELAKLPIEWYGVADLSRMHDLTASALFGH